MRKRIRLMPETLNITPGGPDGDATTLSFLTNLRNNDRWYHLPGFNWEPCKKRNFMAEVGVGDAHGDFFAGITCRFPRRILFPARSATKTTAYNQQVIS